NSVLIGYSQAVLAMANSGGTETIITKLTNVGTFNLDSGNGNGGSSLALGTTLTNSGTVNIGNPFLSSGTTVTATGLVNSGTVNLTGSSSSKQAALIVNGPAPATLGNFNILGDALLQFGSGAVGGIAAGTTFSLRNNATAISLNASGLNTGTFSNAGTLNVD